MSGVAEEDAMVDMASAMTELKRSVQQKQERASKRSKKKKTKKLTKKTKSKTNTTAADATKPPALQRGVTTGGFFRRRTKGLLHSLSGSDLHQQNPSGTSDNHSETHQQQRQQHSLRKSHHSSSEIHDLLSPEKRQALLASQQYRQFVATKATTTKNHFWKFPTHSKQDTTTAPTTITRSSVADKASLAFLKAVQQKYPSSSKNDHTITGAISGEGSNPHQNHPQRQQKSPLVSYSQLMNKHHDNYNKTSLIDDDEDEDDDIIPGPPPSLGRRISSDFSIPEMDDEDDDDNDELSASAHTHLSLDTCSVASNASSKGRSTMEIQLSTEQKAQHQCLVDSWQMLYARDGIEHDLGMRIWKHVQLQIRTNDTATDTKSDGFLVEEATGDLPDSANSGHDNSEYENEDDKMADRCTFLVEFLDMCVHVFSMSVLANMSPSTSTSNGNSHAPKGEIDNDDDDDPATNMNTSSPNKIDRYDDEEDDANSIATAGTSSTSTSHRRPQSLHSALRPYNRELQQLGQHCHRMQLPPALLPGAVLQALDEMWAYAVIPEKVQTVQLWKETLDKVVPRMKILIDKKETNNEAE